MKSTEPERFWSRVDRNGPEVREGLGLCWIWTGGRLAAGYGSVALDRKTTTAHRAAWMLAVGEIQEGMCVCHKCDNPPCVNPAHLFLGSHLDNSNDKIAKGREARGETHGTRTMPHRVARGERSGMKRHPELAMLGSDNPASKLTEEDVWTILYLHAMGQTQAVIAKRFGILRGHVSCITTNRRWRHLKGEAA